MVQDFVSFMTLERCKHVTVSDREMHVRDMPEIMHGVVWPTVRLWWALFWANCLMVFPDFNLDQSPNSSSGFIFPEFYLIPTIDDSLASLV